MKNMPNFFFLLSILCFFSCQKDLTGVSKKPGTDTTTNSIISTNSQSAHIKNPITATPVVKYKATAPIALTNVHDITISYDSITGGSRACISLTNCRNIHITHCKLLNGSSFGVWTEGCVNIKVDSSYFYRVSSGVFAYSSQTIQVIANQFKNMQGPYPYGQFVQFNHVSGAGNCFINNRGDNVSGHSNAEDDVNVNASNGVATSPIMISGNWIRGGTSKTGGGIVLGDNGGSYQTAQNNILVNTAAYGIGIADGTNMQIIGNKIYGAQTPVSNVGIAVQDYYGIGCAMNTITGNYVNWTNSSGVRNDGWNANNCGIVTGWANNTWNANITASILPAVIITYK